MGQKAQKPTTPKIALQILLPLFPLEATMVNNLIGVQKKDGTVYYFNGSMPLFNHSQRDIDSFRFITSQLIINGVCKQKEIVNCFGVSDISVKRWVKRYRESKELSGFVSKKKPGNIKPTNEVIAQVQIKYSQGGSLAGIADGLLIKKDTIQKAVLQNRITLVGPTVLEENSYLQTKSNRTVIDDNTGMGKACSNAAERILSSVTGTPATIKFNGQTGLSCAGTLLGLPALLSNGLLTHSKDFKLDKGYYSEEIIFLCLAFLSLLRVKNLNQANSIPCGELGRVLGLDRGYRK